MISQISSDAEWAYILKQKRKNKMNLALIAIAVVIGIIGTVANVQANEYPGLPHSVIPLCIIFAIMLLCLIAR